MFLQIFYQATRRYTCMKIQRSPNGRYKYLDFLERHIPIRSWRWLSICDLCLSRDIFLICLSLVSWQAIGLHRHFHGISISKKWRKVIIPIKLFRFIRILALSLSLSCQSWISFSKPTTKTTMDCVHASSDLLKHVQLRLTTPVAVDTKVHNRSLETC